jgi:hypothetical protein
MTGRPEPLRSNREWYDRNVRMPHVLELEAEVALAASELHPLVGEEKP